MKKAIISVFDKTGLESFARILVDEFGFEILSTGGTAEYLTKHGIPIVSVSDYTGHPEILEGRVKSLHPKIHGGILCRRDRKEDLDELVKNNIGLIDIVIVNLYPFREKAEEVTNKGEANHPSLIESIDIGGPTLIRAAAKNCEFVIPLCDPTDFNRVVEEMRKESGVSKDTRRYLAAKVFSMMASYDASIARYFSLGEKLLEEQGKAKSLAPVESLVLSKVEDLRYGENPHQRAALYREAGFSGARKPAWEKLQGKEISYNNILDIHAALDLFLDLRVAIPKKETAVIIKHTNPCGVAIRNSALEAFRAARECDPVSAFGGIIAVSGEVDEELAKAVLEDFVEVVIAGAISDEARELFKKKKNVRLLLCDYPCLLSERQKSNLTVRSLGPDVLLQDVDNRLVDIGKAKIVVGKLSTSQVEDLQCAWTVCKNVKSNAIVLVKDGQAIGVGAGQMSRVDSARISLERACLHGHDPKGAVAASDAFLPFADTLEVLNDSGVIALAQPGGSMRDDEVIASAERRKMAMVFTGIRHFRH